MQFRSNRRNKILRESRWGLTLVLLTSIGLSSPPTTLEIEALRQELVEARSDSASELIERAEAMLAAVEGVTAQRTAYGYLAADLSRAHRLRADYARAKEQAEIAIGVGRELSDAKLEAMGHNALGGIFWRRGNYALVWREWLAALSLRESIGDEAGMAATYSNMGILLDEQGDYPGALDYYTRALEIDRRIGSDALEIAATINNIGTVHEVLEDHATALKHYRESLALREAMGDQHGIATSLTNIGSALKLAGDYAGARQAFNRALEIRQKIDDTRGIASTLAELGANEMQAGNLDRARNLTRQSWELRRKTDEPWGVAHSAITLGHVALNRGNPEEALQWFERARIAAEEIGTQLHLLNHYEGVAEAQAALGQWEEAFRAEKSYADLQKRMLGDGARRRMELLEIKNETRRRDFEIAELRLLHERAEAELRQTKWERRVILGSSIGLGIFVVGLGWAFRAQRQARLQLEQAHERLQKLGDEKDHFLRVVAHDLRSPLGNIRWLTGLIREKHNDVETVKTTVGMIDEVAARLVDITTDLLDINRIEAGAINPVIEPVSVSPLMDRLAQSFGPRAAEKQQVLTVETAPNLNRVLADVNLLEQIMENLISNALKYTPSGGTVTVLGGSDGNSVCLFVDDTGPGVGPAQRELLFTKFAQVGNSPTGGEDSHGLGLAIARGLAESMDGTLVYLDNPDHAMGARFRLTLPAAQD